MIHTCLLAVSALALPALFTRSETSSPSPTSTRPESLLDGWFAYERCFVARGDALFATNHEQEFDVRLGTNGLEVTTHARGEHRSTFRIATRAFGRESRNELVAPQPAIAFGERARVVRSGFEEWFENTANGVEQGWTITNAPLGDGAVWIGLEVETDLAFRIADDGRSAKLVDPDGDLVLRYHGLRAWDAAGRPIDARLTPSPDGVGIRVDDRDAIYPITVDPFVDSGWTFEPNQASAGTNDLFVCTAGDVNGDGFSDVIIGVPGFDVSANVNSGKVWVFHGASSGPSMTPAWSVESSTTSFRLGARVSTASDVNSDGYDDVVITGGVDGNAWLYCWHGSASGLVGGGTVGTASFSWNSTDSSAGSFEALASAGDVNGDGYADVIVASERWNVPSFSDGGKAFVFFGSTTGLTSTPVSTSQSVNQVNAHFGRSVAGANDINGDGFDDVLVGAENWSGVPGTGRAFAYFGRSDFAFQDVWEEQAQSQNPLGGNAELFGSTVAGVGDVNGDGFADIAVGAPGAETDQQDEGMCFVYHGSSTGLGATPDGRAEGEIVLASYGQALAPAGDANGDGYADFVVGALRHGTNEQGAVVLLEGGPTGICPGPSYCTDFGGQSFLGIQGLARLGATVSGAGDVDGDGFADFLASERLYDGGESNEGRVRLFLGRPDANPVATGPVVANGTGKRQGAALAILDVGASGRQDLIVGAPESDSGRGRLFLFPGTSSGVSTVSTWTVLGAAGAALGTSVANAGDVNGDGFDDVIAGAPEYDNGIADQGRAFVFHGSGGHVPSTTANWIFTSGIQDARFGASVSAAGDVNGDGYGDVLVGAPGTYSGEASRGSVWLFLGGPLGLSATPAAGTPLSDGGIGSNYGAALANAGDLNRDGYSDVLVAAPSFTGAPPSDHNGEGAVFAYLGTGAGLSTTPVWIHEGGTVGARFGASVAGAGDVNGDGRSDVLVGAPGLGSGGIGYLHLGTSSPPGVVDTPNTTLSLAQTGADFGGSVAAAGDVNGDGFADVLISAPLYDGTFSDTGRIDLYLGTSLGVAASAVWTGVGAGANSNLGTGLAAAGDLDGDGFSDIAGGAPGGPPGSGTDGQANVYAGGGGTTATRLNGQQRAHNDLDAISLLGHSETTDSFSMQSNSGNAAGSSSASAGRIDVRLEYELDLLGVLHDGSNTVHGNWTDSGPILPSNQLRLLALATGLSGSENYHWRLRIESKNPFFPHTRWVTIQGNSRQEKKLGTAFDCNANGTPDDQELFGNDCNGNQVPDDCDIAYATSGDCDPVGPSGPNGIPDECDIAGGAPDLNGDAVPDECQNDVALYCFGDGTGTSCPCGNNSPPGGQDGCANSFGQFGRLRSSGVPVHSADNFVLLGSAMPNSSALYFQGNSQQSGGAGSVFGDGLRCATTSVVRLGTKTNAGNASQYPDGGDLAVSIKGSIPPTGGTRTYQVWYRNSASFCTISVFNLTNGLQAVWQP